MNDDELRYVTKSIRINVALATAGTGVCVGLLSKDPFAGLAASAAALGFLRVFANTALALTGRLEQTLKVERPESTDRAPLNEKRL